MNVKADGKVVGDVVVVGGESGVIRRCVAGAGSWAVAEVIGTELSLLAHSYAGDD